MFCFLNSHVSTHSLTWHLESSFLGPVSKKTPQSLIKTTITAVILRWIHLDCRTVENIESLYYQVQWKTFVQILLWTKCCKKLHKVLHILFALIVKLLHFHWRPKYLLHNSLWDWVLKLEKKKCKDMRVLLTKQHSVMFQHNFVLPFFF